MLFAECFFSFFLPPSGRLTAERQRWCKSQFQKTIGKSNASFCNGQCRSDVFLRVACLGVAAAYCASGKCSRRLARFILLTLAQLWEHDSGRLAAGGMLSRYVSLISHMRPDERSVSAQCGSLSLEGR